MTERRKDAETARLERRLRDAESELAEVRQGGTEREPLLARLAQQLDQDRFASLWFENMDQSRRTT